MHLRKLRTEDAPLMHEWMQDPFVVRDMQTDFASKTLEDCLRFIEAAKDDADNLNLAIADTDDVYMGTVSLKHIHDGSAEFAITVRRSAMGKGYAQFAMHEILRIAFEERGLDFVYWCVDPVNARAVRFYEKGGFKRVSAAVLPVKLSYTEEQIRTFIWFLVTRTPEEDGRNKEGA